MSTSTNDGPQRSNAGPDEETVARASLSSHGGSASNGAPASHGGGASGRNGSAGPASGDGSTSQGGGAGGVAASIASHLSGAFRGPRDGAPAPSDLGRPAQPPRSALSEALSGVQVGAAAGNGPSPSPAPPGGATQQMPAVPPRPAYPTVPVSGGPLAPAPSAAARAPQPQQTGVLAQPQAQPRQAPAAVQRASGPRKVRLNIAKVDPFSVLKLSFLVSVGIGIATVVAAIVVWNVLNGMGVFSDINRLATQIAGENSNFDVNAFVGLGRVVSLATVIAVINVALLTALSTLGAFLYNLSSGLVGGLHVTLSDD